MRRLALVLGLITIVFGVAFTGLMITVAYKDAITPVPQTAKIVKQPTTQPKLPTADQLLVVINNERTKSGVASLTLDARLNSSAQRKSDEMAREGRLEHTNLAGVQGYDYGFEVAPECFQISENLFWVDNLYAKAEDSLAWWKTSKPHYDALLAGKYEYTGFGVSQDGTHTIVVEHFCNPK